MIADVRILYGLMGFEQQDFQNGWQLFKIRLRLPIMLKFKVWKQSEK